MPDSLQTLLPQVISIAQQAGTIIMAIYEQAQVDTTFKEDASPLTEADLAANRHIVDQLRALDPSIPVLSEESKSIPYAQRQPWTRFWLVDPLDGTKEFLKRNGQFTVNIALVNQGTPELGVVYAPALQVAYLGIVGAGSFKQ